MRTWQIPCATVKAHCKHGECEPSSRKTSKGLRGSSSNGHALLCQGYWDLFGLSTANLYLRSSR